MNDNCCSSFRPRGIGEGEIETGGGRVAFGNVCDCGIEIVPLAFFSRQVMNDSLVYVLPTLRLTALDEREDVVRNS